jgi:hypothetical protein
LEVIEKQGRGFVFKDFRQKIGTVERNGSKLEVRLNLMAGPTEPRAF